MIVPSILKKKKTFRKKGFYITLLKNKTKKLKPLCYFPSLPPPVGEPVALSKDFTRTRQRLMHSLNALSEGSVSGARPQKFFFF